MTATTKPPIRLSLRTFTPHEIEELNARLRRRGPAAFRPAEQLLQDIAAGRKPSEEEEPGWFYHPDERVQIALLQREDLTPVRASFDRPRIEAVWMTAYIQAALERVCWTPVLDCLHARRDYWPDRLSGSVMLSAATRSRFPFRTRRKLEFKSVRDLATLASGRLRSEDPASFDLLLQVRSDEFVGFALSRIQDIPAQRFREILVNRPGVGPALGFSICRFPPGPKAVFKAWAIDDLLHANDRLAPLPQNATNASKWNLAYGAHALFNLINYGVRHGEPQLLRPEIDRLFALLDAGGHSVMGPAAMAMRLLVASAPLLEEDDPLRLLPYLKRRPKELAAFISNARHATPRLWQTCLEMTRAKPVVEAIAQIPQATETPAIRTILARSRNAGVLLELLPGASDEEFVRLFRKISRLDLEIASVALTRHTGRASLLRKDDFVPMLKSPNSQHRLLAILMLRMDAGAELLPRRRRRASRPKL